MRLMISSTVRWILILIFFGLNSIKPVQSAPATRYQLPNLTDRQGIDLTKATWHYSSVNPEKAKKENLRKITLPLDKPIQINGNEGWLICEFQVAQYNNAASLYYGTEVILGHINGTDSTYWNKKLIGNTIDTNPEETQRYRRYQVPQDAIKLGEVNQLRIRFAKYPGRDSITAIEPPLTIAPLTTVQANRQLLSFKTQLGKLVRQVYRLTRWKPDLPALQTFFDQVNLIWFDLDLAEKLIVGEKFSLLNESFSEIGQILENLSELSGPLREELTRIEQEKYENDMVNIAALEGLQVEKFKKLERRKWAFPKARPNSFARWGESYEDGLPTLRQITPTLIENSEGQQISLRFNRVLDIQVVDINWVSKTYLVRAEVEIENKKEIMATEIMASAFYPGILISPKFKPYGSVLNPSNIGQLIEMPSRYKKILRVRPFGEPGNVVLGWNGAEGEIPMLLRFTTHPFDRHSMHIAACFPGGIRKFDTRNWSDPNYKLTDLRKFPVIELMTRNFPWQCREYYRYDQNTNRVDIFDVFEYHGKMKEEQHLVFLPPVLSFAYDQGYPIEIEGEPLELGIDTFYGPLKGFYSPKGILHYSLPVPRLDEQIRPRVTADPSMEGLVNQSALVTTEGHGLDGLNILDQARTAAFCGWFQIDPEIRSRLSDSFSQSNPTHLLKHHYLLNNYFWQQSHEPFSGTRLLWSYDRPGPDFNRSYQELGNGLFLYNLYKYIQLTGNWHELNQKQYKIDELWRWLSRSDDWVWMRCSNALQGEGTGTGDCSLAAFSGAWAYAKLTGTGGLKDNMQEGLYQLARFAVPLVAQFYYNKWAHEENLIDKNELIVGFQEGAGFRTQSLHTNSTETPSMISAYGIYPEAMSFLIEHASPGLNYYMETLEAHHPYWAGGNYQNPSEPFYEDYSGLNILPHLYLQSRLGWSQDRFEKMLNHTISNLPTDRNRWLAPPALSEIMAAQSGVFITRWEPAILEDAKIDESSLILKLSSANERPFTVGVYSERKPETVWVSGRLNNNWTYNNVSKHFHLTIEREGEILVLIGLETAEDK